MIYDVIIIGAGASGLFAAASFGNKVSGLILNKASLPGLKLLMSGGGQCNLSQAGDIKDFVTHYGENGTRIRKTIHKFSNQALVQFLEAHGMDTWQREDGKIFPKSMKSSDLLNLLLSLSGSNGFRLQNNSPVVNVESDQDTYTVTTADGKCFSARFLVVATGGASYPTTGSDGNFKNVLAELGISMAPFKSALVPIFVENYGFSALSGIGFPQAKVKIGGHLGENGLLLTHQNFSGPAILNLSRYAKPGELLYVNFLPLLPAEIILKDLQEEIQGDQRQITTLIQDYAIRIGCPLPKRFVDLLCEQLSINPNQKSSGVSKKQLSGLVNKLCKDTYVISGTAGLHQAMVSSGGVHLEELSPLTYETKKHPHLYIIGEALDVDGDTGGYNIQFAFSSGHLCARDIQSRLSTSQE